eukprot:3711931-Rhodomonas_salina.1
MWSCPRKSFVTCTRPCTPLLSPVHTAFRACTRGREGGREGERERRPGRKEKESEREQEKQGKGGRGRGKRGLREESGQEATIEAGAAPWLSVPHPLLTACITAVTSRLVNFSLATYTTDPAVPASTLFTTSATT